MSTTKWTAGPTGNVLERVKALSYEVKRVWGCDLTHVAWFPNEVAWDVENEVHRQLRTPSLPQAGSRTLGKTEPAVTSRP